MSTTCPKPKPHGIDLSAPGGIEALLTFHRATFGNATMRTQVPDPDPANSGGPISIFPGGLTTAVVPVAPAGPVQPPAPPAAQPPPAAERPDGVTEAEWAALGDPGKAALTRERARASAAEQELARVRAASAPKPGPPVSPTAPPAAPAAPPSGPTPPASPAPPAAPAGQPDIAALVRQAVGEALAPVLQRDADSAAQTIADTLVQQAAVRFWDASDALAQVDLTTLTDGTGRPDPAKITAALDALLIRKPHLGKPTDPSRRPPPGSGVGAGGVAAAPLDDRVKATLARMQSATGVKFAPADV